MLWTAHKRNMPKSEPIPLKDVPRIVLEALWGLVTVVIIMGGILSGVFTPTESAAVACVYAFLVTFFVYRDYKWRDLPHLVHRVVKTVAMVMMLIGFSVAFGYMMAMMQIPAKVTAFFLSISENKYVFLLLVNILLLLLGTFMDLAPMLLICTPIFLPVILKLGIDPVHFGMIMILNLGIGLITPPVGPTLFVGCAIGKVTMEQVIEGAMAVLRRDVPRAAAGDLHPGHLAVAARTDEVSWQPSARLPDAGGARGRRLVRALPPAALQGRAPRHRLHRWAEGPVWFGDERCLLWSDVPGNCIWRWDEDTGATSVFRKPSGNANGNTRDRQGRLITCEHGGRRVSRTEYDGRIVTLADSLRGQAAQFAERHRVQVRRLDLVHRPELRHPRPLRGREGRARAADQRLPLDPTGKLHASSPKASTSPTASPSRPTSRSSTSSSRARCRARSWPSTSGRNNARQPARADRRRAQGHARRLPRRRRRQPVVRLGHGRGRASTACTCSTPRAA